jgi:hypothetical protein
MAEQRFSVPLDPTKTAATQANIAASGASNQTERDARAAQDQLAPNSTTSNSLAMRLAISKEAVAAGEGAFSTCTWRGARW